MTDSQGQLVKSPNDEQMNLLAYVMCDKHVELSHLLSKRRCEINYVYQVPFEMTILEIACFHYANKTNPKCIKLLLINGAQTKNALKYAALGGNIDMLLIILEHLEENAADISTNTVILSIINYVHFQNKDEKKYAEIIRLLLEHGVNVNNKQRNVGTAIYLAAKYNLQLIISTLINAKFREIDLDSYVNDEHGCARDIILMRKLYAGILPQPVQFGQNSNENAFELLNVFIKQSDEHAFITQHIKNRNLNKFDTAQEYHFLLQAAKQGQVDIVRYLLCCGRNPNASKSWIKLSPLRAACVRGYYKVVEVLIKYSNSSTVSRSFVAFLASVCLQHKCIISMDIDHRKCFEYLLYNRKLQINYRYVATARTPLHYAIRNQTADIVRELLSNGASLAYLHLSDKPWTVFVEPKLLEEHLNECIHITQVNSFNNDMTMQINLKSLLPEQENHEKLIIFFDNEKDYEVKENCPSSDSISETKVFEYICNKPEYSAALKHPVVQIFLDLKWDKLRVFFYINFLFYLIFSGNLINHIVLAHLGRSETWYQIIYYTNLTCLIILLVCFSGREFLQMYIFKKDYFKYYDNYIELALVLVTITMLCKSSTEKVWFDQLAATAVLLVSVEFLLMFGRHTNILFTTTTMLIAVCLTFLKLLLPYVILIAGFSASFFLLFGDGDDAQKQIFFSNPLTAILKTVVMLTGEFDADQINFSKYPVLGPVIFILFIFLMHIALFGVFTALAINDIKKIQEDAEFEIQRFRIKHIAYWNKVLRRSKFISKFSFVAKILNTQPIINMRLTKNSKLYFEKKQIKLNEEVMQLLKNITVAQMKHEERNPPYKTCPRLRHSSMGDERFSTTLKRITTALDFRSSPATALCSTRCSAILSEE